MSVATPVQRADRGAEYELHRPAVIGALRGRFPGLQLAELEELYHEAWAGALAARERGTAIAELEGYLVRAAFNAGLDRAKSHAESRTERVDPFAAALVEVASEDPTPEREVEGALEAALCREIIESLGEREREVAKLRLDWQLEPEEICGLLEITPRTYRRLIERAGKSIAERVEEVADGRWRQRQRELAIRCQAGLASPAQRAKAQRLLRDDPAFRAMARTLRRASSSVAAVLPVPSLGVEHSPAGTLVRLSELAGAARDQIANAALASKQGLLALVGRAPGADATAQVAAGGGFRGSGTLASAAIACVIAGGGAATYCAQNGIPEPVRDFIGAGGPERDKTGSSTGDAGSVGGPPAPGVRSEAPASNNGVGPTGRERALAGQSESPTEHGERTAPREFGFENGGGGGSSASRGSDGAAEASEGEFSPSAPAAPKPARQKKPAPSGGGSEFGPE